jgi:hypothetical protein
LSVRRVALALFVSACLAACGQSAPAPETAPIAESSAPVISAEGYGPVRIGMTIEEAAAALGQPLNPDMDFDEPEFCQTLHIGDQTAEGALRFMAQHGRITRISDYQEPDALTAEGLGVRSTDAEIRAAYPGAIEQPAKYDDPPAHDLIVWTVPDESGIRFEINSSGTATILHAGDESILLVEGCL